MKNKVTKTPHGNVKKICIVVFISGIVFIYGISVGVFGLPPYEYLKNAWFMIQSLRGAYTSGEEQLISFAFSDPIIPGELIYDPIHEIEDIYIANKEIFMPYEKAFVDEGDLYFIEANEILINDDEAIIKIEYEIHDVVYEAYSYYVNNNSEKSVFIIPGSGLNQAYFIYTNASENYHFGIMDIFSNDYDKYILIKPNEGILAHHNGEKKLSYDFIINWHLGHGSSYSTRYIVDAIAFMSFLKEEYKTTFLAGLSQGGLAALYVALRSEPDVAIISSGFSILSHEIQWSGFGQIVIPGFDDFLYGEDQYLIRGLNEIGTHFLFTWGNEEIGTYRMEAEKEISCLFLEENVHSSNFNCLIHDHGHVFPVEEITQFLEMKGF